MRKQLLKLLNKNARVSLADLAVALGADEAAVADEIKALEAEGILRGYKAVIDWEKMDHSYVSAIIELKVTPKVGRGFEEIAERVAQYAEVESVYLMSGTYDLNVVVKAKTFQEVAMFVAKELSTIESVTSTATHFVLRRYKELDVSLAVREPDERGTISLC
ncbi:MAG: Lrp/AsnC family transcriptional regulator [Clostridia bacterium]|nr:Lrp/AsnC family transcriptional regulator [Clostridia bacterium]